MAHGFSVQGGLGAGGSVILHEFSDHSVLVPDTELLFTAQFHRAGPDLVLTGRDGAHHLVPGYFSSEHHPALVAPNGAHLSADTVDLLAGSAMPGHYAQAQPTAPADSIGKIEKVVGDVTVVRNGVSVALHVGDAVFKSDVVQTGASSSCGISFPDGTALNLVANTRMALNDYAFDASSNANGALFTLVEGTFAFVAGKVAHQGDMKIATPVATMGIRGTTGVVQEQPNAPATITATAGDHTYSFAVVPDIGTGVTGMWDVYLTDANGIIQRDANGNPIVLVTVSQAGYVTYVTPQGVGQQPLVTTEPVTNSQYAFEQEMLQQLFRTLNPANLNNNNNGGSSTTPPPFELPNPIPQLFEDSGKPFTINLSGSTSSISVTVNDTVGSSGPLTIVIWVTANSGPWSAGPNWLGGSPPTSPQEVEILNPVKVTTDGADSAAGLVINPGATLNIVSGTSFTIYDFIHGAGTVALNSSGSDPTLFIHGAVSLVGGGTIKMLGPTGEDNILGVSGTGAVLVNIDYTIEGTGTIGGGDGILTFENFGTVNANDGLLTINTGNVVANNGLMEATVGGTLLVDDGVSNVGTIKADGSGSAVTFDSAAVTNLAGGTINATNAGTVTFEHGSLANAGTLEATNGGILQLEHLTVTNSAAGELSIDALSELDLMSAAVIGGTSTNAGNVVVTDGASVLHGDSVTNSGTMTVEAGASLTLEGNTTLINEAGGLIKADGGTVAIELDTDTNVNSGTIEAVNGGEVDFYINVEGGSNHGLIEAGAGGTVHFFDTHGGGGGGGGPQGGNHGTMEATDGGVLIFDGGLNNFYLVEALNGGLVYLNNGIKNQAGTVDAAGSGSQISISGGDNQSENAGQILAEHDGVISLASVELRNDAGATIDAASGGSISWITGGIDNLGTFSAGNNGTITFGGDIGITNEIGGIFQAALGGSIVFGAADSGSVSNDGGTIVATDGGTITFDSTLNGAENIDGGIIKAGTGGTIIIDGFQHGNQLSNAGNSTLGTIEAIGTGAKVELSNAKIFGGKLHTDSGGIFETVSGTSELINVIMTGGVFSMDANTILDLNGGFNGVAAYIDSTVIFEGAGVVEMDSPSTSILGGNSNGTLQNETTIKGQGTIGSGDTALPGVLTLINSGLIEAVGGQFTINTGTRNSATTTNSGTLEANGANAVLLIHHTNMNNAGGTIAALNATDAANASVVELLDDVIAGGKLQTSHLGTIETITDNGAATTTVFDGVANQGYVLVNDNTTLLLRHTIDNTGGKIALALSGQSDLQIDGTVTLKNGEVELNTGNDTITALATGAKLENSANIHGHGVIGTGDGKLTLDNLSGGIINADVGTLIIYTGTTVTNDGLMKAINGASLTIETAVDNTTTGTMLADGYGSYLFATDGLTNQGLIEACNSGTVVLSSESGLSNLAGGTIEAIGAISGPFSEVVISASAGAGQSSIDNAGQILALKHGYVSLTGNIEPFDNYGTIKADDGQIVIETTATLGNSDNLTNHDGGVIEALNGGVVTIGAAGVVFNLGGGLLKADGGTLALNATGGVTNDAGATIEADDGGILQFTTLTPTLDNAGTIKLNDGTLVVVGSVILPGGGNLTLDGGGTVTLSDDSGNAIKSGGAAATFTNVDNTISGAGTIGDAHLTLHNEQYGVIDADDVHALVLDTGGNTIANEGLLEATNGATLDIHSVVNNDGGTIKADGGTVDLETSTTNIGTIEAVNGGTVDFNGGILNNTATSTVEADGGTINVDASIENYGGTIEAVGGGIVTIGENVTVDQNFGGILEATGAGSEIEIEGGTTVKVGTIETSDGGLIEVLGGDNTFLNVIIEDGSFIQIDDGATLTLQDTTTLDGTVTLEGDGTVLLQPTNSQIAGGVGGGTLVNETTIEGGGTIGGSGLVLDNQSSGIIDAASHLIIDTGNKVTNAGTLEATNGGTLEIHDSVTNTGGTIAASGANAVIELFGATITGGTVESSGGGIIETPSGTSTLDGVTVNDGSILKADTGSSLDLEDTTTLNGTVTLEGGGTFVLDPGPASIVGGLSGATLDIAIGAKLTGSGDIGNAGAPDATSLTLNNGGTIDGNVSGATLDIDTGNTVTNTGTLEASNCGTLKIDDAVNNAGGTIKALHGGSITIDGGTLDDESATDGVAGGLVEATARGATITFDNIAVTLDSAVAGGGGTIKASNGGAIVFNCGTINSAISAPVSGGLIEALTCGTVTFNGTTVYNQGSSIEADGIGAMILLAGATILGGTLETSAHGVIETVACSGNSTLDGVTIAAGSAIQVGDHTTLTLQDTFDDNAAITNDGTITLGQCDAGLIVSGDLTLAGHGTVALSGDTDSIVGTGKGADTLHNANTIEGAGTIGGDGLVLINQSCGVVDADASGHTLVLDTGTTVTNLGVLEATHGGILEIDDNVCNIGGTIAAYGCGSVVELEGVTIKGGMFLTDGSTSGDRGVIEVASTDAATVFDGGSGHAVSIGGFVHVVGGASLELIGTIDLSAHGHDGTIDVDLIHVASSPDIGADLVISGTVTLTGSGAVVMEGDAAKITAAAHGAALHNETTIVGAGSIGVGDCDLTLVNEWCGTINANNASADSLTIDTGGNTVANHGLLEATGGATLVINSDVDNSCGTIQAVGCDSTVNIDQITVSHGTLQTSCNGLIQVVCGESTFCDVHVNGGNLTVEGDATLKLSGVTVDGTNIDDYTDSGSTVIPGTIEIIRNSAINHSTVDGEGGPADNGSPGVIMVDCHTTLTLDSTTLEDLNLTNNGALHVAGSSEVTLDSVSVTNNGCINVDVTNSGAILTLDDDSTITGGTLKIGSAGALDIATGNDGTGHGATLDGVAVTNDLGNIDVDVTDSGAVLTLDDDTTITGGNLTTGTYGALHIATGIDGSGHGATLDGVNVIDNGDINLDSGAILTLDDGTKITGTATGTLTIAAGDTVDVEHGSSELNHGAIFDGLTVNDNGGALDIGDVNSGAILTLDDGTTITGGGTGTLTINANNTLDVEKGSGDGPAVTGATLDGLNVTVGGALDVGDAPAASGAVLTLDDGTTVIGPGTLTINFGNTLDIEKGANDGINGATLAGINVQDNGAIDIGDGAPGAVLTLNDGTQINGGGTAALTINAGSTLEVNDSGGGGATLDDVHVTDNGALNIDDVTSGAILTLQDDATVTGGGIGTMTIQVNNTVDVENGINGGATLDGVNVTLYGALDVGDVLADSGAILTLDDGTTVTGNGAGTMTINANNAVDVEHGGSGGATLDGVNVTLNGALDVGDVLANSGAILTLDDGTTVTGGGGDGAGTMTINANNTVDVENGINGGATLDGVNVTLNGALDIGDVASGATLTLDDGTTITGDGINGTLTINYGNTLDVEFERGCVAQRGRRDRSQWRWQHRGRRDHDVGIAAQPHRCDDARR